MEVSIRPITIEDTANIVKWRNKPFVLNNFIDQRHITEESHTQYFETRIKTKEVYQFIINADGKDCGTVFLRDIDTVNQKGEFGILIGEEDCLHKGVGNKAAKLILAYAFDVLKLNKVFLRVLKRNEGAIASYLKAGFKEDGVFRQDVYVNDTFEDVVFMSILKDEYI